MVRIWWVVADGRNLRLSGIGEGGRMQMHGVHATPPTQTAKFGLPNAHRTGRAIYPKLALSIIWSALVSRKHGLRANITQSRELFEHKDRQLESTLGLITQQLI